jgi:hypothetical protein
MAFKLSFFYLPILLTFFFSFYSCESKKEGFRFAGSQLFPLDSTESPIIFDSISIEQYRSLTKTGKCSTPLSKAIQGIDYQIVFMLCTDCSAKVIGENFNGQYQGNVIDSEDNKVLIQNDSIYDYAYFYDVEGVNVTAIIHYLDQNQTRVKKRFELDYVKNRIEK